MAQRGTIEALLIAFGKRLTSVERRLVGSSSGSSSARDSVHGVPTSDAESVALANARPFWFNTDLGWEESYYATAGLSQLGTPGLAPGIPSGWYPTGVGPSAAVYMVGSQAQVSSNVISRWSFAGNGYRRGGDSWFELFNNNTSLRAKRAGRYRLDMSMTFPDGSGTGVCSWRGSAVEGGVLQYPVPLLAGYGQVIQHQAPNRLIKVNEGIYHQTDAASWTIGNDSHAFMAMTYIGPPLAMD